VVPPVVVPPVVVTPIVQLDLPSASSAKVRIPGYIAVPQGTVEVNNPNGHAITVIGGILAAKISMPVVDGRVTGPACTGAPTPGVNCVDLGFESESVQKRLRIVSTTPDGIEESVAVVQVNENGAYAVNSWEVQ
jgi:hypothetical protein